MNDSKHLTDSKAVTDARARRRRMHRRIRKRRLTHVFLAASTAFALALVFTPSVPKPAVARFERTLLRATPAEQLLIEPFWRRAADAIKGPKTQPLSALPFGLDSKIGVHGESLGRWHRIYTYTTRYRIAPDLARKIYDAAVAAGIEPELGFRLVRVESVFDPRAKSPSGALGLMQLMPSTAREFEATVTNEQLLNPEVNLRIGFRYLRSLIREYQGNLRLALLVYNRGPNAVQHALSLGNDPANGYESLVMRGYRGRGTLN